MRNKVAAAKAGGMAEELIALALGITRPTLQKHFMVELTTGAAVKRMDALAALFAAARKGNVPAIKAVLLLNGAAGGPPQPAEGEPVAPPPPARLGKKQEQQLAATTAAEGTEWEGLLPGPRSVQ